MAKKILERLAFKLDAAQVRKYVLHSLGEILFIMIGVLLAMQVGNINDQQKERRLERKILNEIRDNLRQDLVDMETNLQFSKNTYKANSVILTQLENQLPFHDTLQYYYANILGSTTFLVNTSAYENLKNVGFNIISNDSLRISISKLYATRYAYITNFEGNINEKYQLEQMIPMIRSRVKITAFWQKASPVNPAALAEDIEFQELLRMNTSIWSVIIKSYEETIPEVSRLIKAIDEELE